MGGLGPVLGGTALDVGFGIGTAFIFSPLALLAVCFGTGWSGALPVDGMPGGVLPFGAGLGSDTLGDGLGSGMLPLGAGLGSDALLLGDGLGSDTVPLGGGLGWLALKPLAFAKNS